MSMTTGGVVKSVETRMADGPKGAANVLTTSSGVPADMPGDAAEQSPASLIQPKGPTVVATFSGK